MNTLYDMANAPITCQCPTCKLSVRLRTFKKKISPELASEIDSIYDDLFCMAESDSTDLCCLNSKIEGSWPTDSNGKYYTRIGDKLYEVHGVLVNEEICNHDPYESLNSEGKCDYCCDHVFDSDGGSCRKCGKTVSELLLS